MQLYCERITSCTCPHPGHKNLPKKCFSMNTRQHGETGNCTSLMVSSQSWLHHLHLDKPTKLRWLLNFNCASPPHSTYFFMWIQKEFKEASFCHLVQTSFYIRKEGRKETKSNGFAKTTEKNYLNKLSLHLISCPPHYFTATFKERAHSF